MLPQLYNCGSTVFPPRDAGEPLPPEGCLGLREGKRIVKEQAQRPEATGLAMPFAGRLRAALEPRGLLLAGQASASRPGIFHPGGAASSAWFRGLLRRPSSAARTTEECPISGPGILPCVVQQPRPPSGGGAKIKQAIGPIGPMGRREDAFSPSYRSYPSYLPFHLYIRVACDDLPVAPGLMATGWGERAYEQATSG